VLLTGLGGDNLFTGDMVFFADWLVAGHWARAFSEMARRAVQGRVSFWELAYKNALRPLLPLALQRLLVPDIRLPAWMPRETVRQFGLRAGAGLADACGGSLGHKYGHALGGAISGMAGTTPDGISEDLLDVRHPFVYRPLVEFALQLPPEMCARPQARKWILREAMRGILPEKVRTRIGKGIVAGVMSWSLIEHRERWQRMLRTPILAELGCIDLKPFRAAYASVLAAPSSSLLAYGQVQHTLCIEAWLEARAGRWTAESGGPCSNQALETSSTAVPT
jgi:asparagine synthase (glutamine-hydrolysing)